MSKRQIPHGPDDLKCPMWKKPMVEVCHACPLWVQLRGLHPQSGQEIDEWNCSLGFLPMLLVEHGRQQRSTAAAVETMTAEMQKTDAQSAAAVGTLVTLLNRTLDIPRLPNGHGDAQRLIEN